MKDYLGIEKLKLKKNIYFSQKQKMTSIHVILKKIRTKKDNFVLSSSRLDFRIIKKNYKFLKNKYLHLMLNIDFVLLIKSVQIKSLFNSLCIKKCNIFKTNAMIMQ